MSKNCRILTIDIGNSSTKGTIFDGESAVDTTVFRGCAMESVKGLIDEHKPDGIVYCCVGKDNQELSAMLEATGIPMLKLSHETPLPIAIEYGTPATLGLDRIAGAVGVAGSKRGTLLVDAGTAVTLDVVVDNRFLGGNISPGLRLRCGSLHDYTSNLPLVEFIGETPRTGYDTVTAIRSGAVRGLQYEIIGTLEYWQTVFSDMELVLTGGDASVIAPLLDDAGVAYRYNPSVVGIGLVRIFNFNNPE